MRFDPADVREGLAGERLGAPAACVIVEEQQQFLRLRRKGHLAKALRAERCPARDPEQGCRAVSMPSARPSLGAAPPRRTEPPPNGPRPHLASARSAMPLPRGPMKVRWMATSPASSRTAAIKAGRNRVAGFGPKGVRG